MERPSGVTILAVLSFLGAALAVLGACGMFLMGAAGIAAAATLGLRQGRGRHDAPLPSCAYGL